VANTIAINHYSEKIPLKTNFSEMAGTGLIPDRVMGRKSQDNMRKGNSAWQNRF
jgi:hypothetical protein